ncbi:hypothetical protein CFOL_v3_11606 [Cephalotus follicularis]|uniref:Uncharacterized protein n=1 Tax=Cephalotus follicularis TaxID=3775 RepID=A0A1Q3BK47_CEPFO|nr:hypothetical protein CFOL_v3_11606 [Cephalotus follicularis]
MESSTPILQSNPGTLRKKRRKLESNQMSPGDDKHPRAKKWTTEREQLVYSSKLIDALRHSQGISSPPPKLSDGPRIRQIADRVLDVSAKGTTRWSRAILTSQLRYIRRLSR